VDPRSGLDDDDPTGTRTPNPSVVQPVASRQLNPVADLKYSQTPILKRITYFQGKLMFFEKVSLKCGVLAAVM
jgi:hypothetical protein